MSVCWLKQRQSTCRITVFQYKLVFELKCKIILLITSQLCDLKQGCSHFLDLQATFVLIKSITSTFHILSRAEVMFCTRDHCSAFTSHSLLLRSPPLHAIDSNCLLDCDGLIGHPCFKKYYVFSIKVVTNLFKVLAMIFKLCSHIYIIYYLEKFNSYATNNSFMCHFKITSMLL